MIIGISMKETTQIAILESLKNGEISQVCAAHRLGWTTRWVRKKLQRYKQEGAAGLVHRNRGKPSKKAWDKEQKAYAMVLFEGLYHGFGPTFAAEKLEEVHNIKVSRETLRKAMIANGHWHGKKRKIHHRTRRKRKEFYGEMVQVDGSPHDWFEDRGPRCTLINFVDDATSSISVMMLVPSESTEGVAVPFRKYIEHNGVPHSVYVDYGSVYSVNINNADHDKITQFERMCNEVGTKLIKAGSPQAKGRVERSHGTHQDRLVKELRLAGISTIDTANTYINDVYLPAHNKKFAIKAANKGDIHKPATHLNLDTIFCLKERRVLQNDFTLTYKKQILQLTAQQRAVLRPKESIIIHEKFDGSLELYIRGIRLNFTGLSQRPNKPKLERIRGDRKPCKPAANHPWRVYTQQQFRSTPRRE